MTKEDDFLRTRLSYAVVIRAELPVIEEVKRALAKVGGVEIIYQCIDGGKLWIKRENEEGGR